MSVLEVGDKLKVMVHHLGGTDELVGNILTVTKPDGYLRTDPNLFETDTTGLGTGSRWSFSLDSIKDRSLIVVTISVPVSATNPVVANKCECGAASIKDHLHSHWCNQYQPKWKMSGGGGRKWN